MMLTRLADLSPTRVLVMAAIWPLLLALVVVLFIAIEVALAHRSSGLIAISVNVFRAFLTLLVLPPLAFIGLAAAARRRSRR